MKNSVRDRPRNVIFRESIFTVCFCFLDIEIKVILLDVILDWRSTWIPDPGYSDCASDILVFQPNPIGKPIVTHRKSLKIMIWEPNLTSKYKITSRWIILSHRSKLVKSVLWLVKLVAMRIPSRNSPEKYFT